MVQVDAIFAHFFLFTTIISYLIFSLQNYSLEP